MLPKTLHRYFWDTKPAALDPKQHQRYIIERLLELGDEEAVKWLFRQFKREEIKDVLTKSRQLSPKSRSYWELTLTKSDLA